MSPLVAVERLIDHVAAAVPTVVTVAVGAVGGLVVTVAPTGTAVYPPLPFF
jgi:hypothetical protein